MKIASFSIADYCEATEGMPHDVERLYFRMIMKMLSREAGLPDDDRENARMFGYRDVRAYKPLKAKLLKWPDTIFIEDGLIKNERVEEDLLKHRERRAQAAKDGQIGGRSNRDRPEIDRRSTGDRPEIDPDIARDRRTQSAENNDLAEASPSPTPTEEKKDLHQLASVETETAVGDLAGLNGSAEPMIRDVLGWMIGGTEKTARQWLSTTVGQYGQVVTRDSYAKLKTDLATGLITGHPMRTWVAIAQRMSREPRKTTLDQPRPKSRMWQKMEARIAAREAANG